VGRGILKREYHSIWNPATGKVTWRHQEYTLTKWVKEVRFLHDPMSKCTVGDIWKACRIVTNEGLKTLKDLQPPTPAGPHHWLIRVADGECLTTALPSRVFGANSKVAKDQHFLTHARPGDVLWFVKNKSDGLLLAVATYTGQIDRRTDLLGLTHSDEVLGWNGKPVDTEITYKDIYNIERLGLKTHLGSYTTDKTLYNTFTPYHMFNLRCDVPLPQKWGDIQSNIHLGVFMMSESINTPPSSPVPAPILPELAGLA
jgi:hypothetical protein